MAHVFYLGWLGGALSVAAVWVLHPTLVAFYRRRRSAFRRSRLTPIVAPPSVAEEAERWLKDRS